MKENWLIKFLIELFGYSGMILLFSCIWIPNYRGRLFFTGIFLWFLAIMDFLVLKDREKKWQENTPNGTIESLVLIS